MFAYFKLKIDFTLSLCFIRKPPKGKYWFPSFGYCSECQGHWLHVAPHTAGGGAPLRPWQLAERKVFESDMNLVVMKSVKHLLYLIRKHQVIFPSSCLSLLLHSCKKAGSSSVLSQFLSTWGQWEVPGLGVRRPECLLRLWYKLPGRP